MEKSKRVFLVVCLFIGIWVTIVGLRYLVSPSDINLAALTMGIATVGLSSYGLFFNKK